MVSFSNTHLRRPGDAYLLTALQQQKQQQQHQIICSVFEAE
ncbi:hypothetical protein N9L68_01750 [bacterium]|nr:hypothetical protein [bacterium]